MIKYEISVEKAVETRTRCKNWTAEEILEDYDNKTARYPELVTSFDSEEEARAYFESQKQYCSTDWWKGCASEGIYYDVLMLDEAEYDEDGEFIMSSRLDAYASAYNENQ